jgi:sugar phosphate isomerase/epimerase
MPGLRLTYCGNVHPADDLSGWLRTLDECAAPVATHCRQRGRTFGVGAWWNAAVAATLATDAGARDRARASLDRLGLPIWTLNVFPHGGFHDAVVKTAVYRPDWSSEERLRYTRQAAEAAAMLSQPGAVLPLSTLPLGYRAPGEAAADLRLMARNLARAASAFAALEQRTGVRCVLALEPEPFCLLETCAQAAAFLERWLFEEGAWTTVPPDVLRRHLGVCVDLCHLAVVGEEPVAALQDLAARHIAVPKIQVSSCLEVRDGAAALDRLLGFDEPRYLHQTVAAAGARALDLGEVRTRRAEFAQAGPIRTHFHVPLWWDEAGPFGSTRAQVERTLAALSDPVPLLEVETYTWPVLGDLGGAAPLVERLCRELDFAAKHLGA